MSVTELASAQVDPAELAKREELLNTKDRVEIMAQIMGIEPPLEDCEKTALAGLVLGLHPTGAAEGRLRYFIASARSRQEIIHQHVPPRDFQLRGLLDCLRGDSEIY